MADDTADWLQQIRHHAGGQHLRDWQIFPQLTERMRQGDLTDLAQVLDLGRRLAEAHPDVHVRRWALAFLGLVAEHHPELADQALGTLLAVLAGDWPWENPVPPALWDAAVSGLSDLAVRLPALILPWRSRLAVMAERPVHQPFGLPVSRILDRLREGRLNSLRHRTVRSTPKLLDEVDEASRFAIWEKDRFHTPTCGHLLRQVGVRLVPLASMAEAMDYGFQPCSSCHRMGKDGAVSGKPPRTTAKKPEVPPPPPTVSMGRVPYVEELWAPPSFAGELDLAHVPPPSAYARLKLLSPDQQRVIGLWLQGDLRQLPDVHRVIYARHHAALLQGAHAAVALEALERATVGIPKDAWSASQLVMAAAVAAYRAADPDRFARILAERPETVFDYPFLVHMHGDLGAVMTPQLLFALRKLSGTRSSATITKRWPEFLAQCDHQIRQFVAEHDGDPIRQALLAGKGRSRVVSFAFGREFVGEVRFLDVLHGLPLARATGDVLSAVLTAMKPVTAASRRAQRQQAERAELEALHRTPDAAQAVRSLIADLAVSPGAGRIVAEQGMRAFEAGDMIKATAYLAKALAVSPDMTGAGIFRRALDRAAAEVGVALAGL